SQGTADRLYSLLVEEEDARVCKDIPAESCTRVPGNFFKISASQTLTKLSDEISSAKTVLPWVLGAVGAPPALIGFLVPIRESGSLLPQLFIAAGVRRRPLRKPVWVLGAVLQAFALAGIGIATLTLRGLVAGAAVIGLLAAFSLARGLVSVASKDVIGKTVPKTRRGRLTGFTTALSGVLTLLMGLLLTVRSSGDPTTGPLVMLLGSAAVLWVLAGAIFSTVEEVPGATDGGKNAIREALARLDLLRTDRPFRSFVGVRALLISTGLAAPYYVALAREGSGGMGLLGSFVLASGLAAALASGFWGRFSDRSSRRVLIAGATMAASLGLMVFLLDMLGLLSRYPWIAPLAFFCLSIAHSGVRVGRKTYLLDMAGGNRRTDYVAVSNSVIGAVLLLGSAVGFLVPLIGPSGVLLVLSLMGFAGALWGTALPEAQ
ncbi:MAG: MFS transporter, partial [Gemmatimonadota bacterium]